MTKLYGGQNMIDPLKRVLVRRPDTAFAVDDPELWNYTSRPDLAIAQAEHDSLVQTLKTANVEVVYHDQDLPDHADSIFVFDPAFITDEGAIILSMGKDLRRGEEAAIAKTFESLDIPILYTLSGDARADGGDLLWLDDQTLAVGQGFRTNPEGFRQITEAVAPLGVQTIPVELPYYQGEHACLHLLSLISTVDEKMAVVYPSLMVVSFWRLLNERGFKLIEVSDEEFLTQAPNVLAISPGVCLMLQGNPLTKRKLEESGCEVMTYKGEELSLKAEGGPTCLTRPILRSK